MFERLSGLVLAFLYLFFFSLLGYFLFFSSGGSNPPQSAKELSTNTTSSTRGKLARTIGTEARTSTRICLIGNIFVFALYAKG